MIDLSLALRTRLFTAFGTVVYFDQSSRELRHGPVESSPANALFVADPSLAGVHQRGWLTHSSAEGSEPLVCQTDGCRPVSVTEAAEPAALELIPLERGLIGLAIGGQFLSALPDGELRLSAPICRTWELFLTSESWCTEVSVAAEQGATVATTSLDLKQIQSYVIHPINRVRAGTKSKRSKILIYGYLRWSHGRVYYDLCKRLHREGYIVDILDWQIDHTGYINHLMTYYELCISALDGVATLISVYGISPERIIALSHHELDMRMLIDQKGVDVFDSFAAYGVVSEYLYGASVMRGIGRIPMVASLGINYEEFYSEVPARLTTVGYAGSMSVTTFGIEWKRGDLAQAAAQEAGLDFRIAGWTGDQISFLEMPDFYRTVDAVLISSINEGAGLPAMEAAAAGRLVISTPVGHFPIKAYCGGGIIAPIEATKFKTFAVAELGYYKENPAAYVGKCIAIRDVACRFDWKFVIHQWIELIEAGLCTMNIERRKAEY